MDAILLEFREGVEGAANADPRPPVPNAPWSNIEYAEFISEFEPDGMKLQRESTRVEQRWVAEKRTKIRTDLRQV